MRAKPEGSLRKTPRGSCGLALRSDCEVLDYHRPMKSRQGQTRRKPGTQSPGSKTAMYWESIQYLLCVTTARLPKFTNLRLCLFGSDLSDVLQAAHATCSLDIAVKPGCKHHSPASVTPLCVLARSKGAPMDFPTGKSNFLTRKKFFLIGKFGLPYRKIQFPHCKVWTLSAEPWTPYRFLTINVSIVKMLTKINFLSGELPWPN